MLKVGIHENIALAKAVRNDQGTLVIGFKKVQTDALAAFNSSDLSSGGDEEQDFLLYPPRATNRMEEPDTATNNTQKVREFKDQLTHILSAYLTKDKITWDILKDTGVTAENMAVKMTQQETLDIIYKNIVDQFIAMATPILNDPKQKLTRCIFIRASKAKHYPALRRRFLDSNPFIESMEIPASASKLAFTKWEIKEGFNNPEPVQAASEADAFSAESANIADSVFNQ